MVCGKRIGSFFFFLLVFTATQFAFSQDTLRVRWILNDRLDEWVIRKDIFAFKIKANAVALPSSDAVIRKTELAGINNDLLLVYFDAAATEQARTQRMEQLQGVQGMEHRMVALQKNAAADAPDSKILFADDHLFVSFKNELTRSQLNHFSNKYDLQLVSAADGASDKKTYLFRYANISELDNSATVCAKISRQEKGRVRFAHPNRVNLFEPQSSGDSDIERAWHVENNGQSISCYNLSGDHEADARISDAWNVGYTGSGIKVGVIDFFGFDFNHPDMQGQFLAGWDCINNQSYSASNFYFTQNNQAHGMAVAGIIGAKANNGIGAAGVAYDAKIIPFLVDGSEASIILAMQKARSNGFDVDIINCSFGSYFPSPAIEAEIQNLVNNGRVRNGAARGVTVVASHGNDHYSDIDHPQYPSAYDEVISVGASTPDDKKKSPTDSWNAGSAWGTNYGSLLDVAAPGVCIYTTDLSGGDGYGTGDYTSFQKTSASAPIVAGIVALLLSKENELDWQEVKTRITTSADKVHNGTYNYNAAAAGKSLEMGFGRVNAFKALGGPVGIAADPVADELFQIQTITADRLEIRLTNSNEGTVLINIFDMSGRMMFGENVNAETGAATIEVGLLTGGLYLVKCTDENGRVFTKKFIKAL